MKIEVGSFSINSTGPNTLVLNDSSIDVKTIECWIGNTASNLNYSIGMSDGNAERAVSTYRDSTLTGTERTTGYFITHYKNTSNAMDRIIAFRDADFSVTGDVSFVADDADVSYSISYRVIGE